MADSSNLAVHAYDAIKKRILEFHYRPGERLSEARLASDLGLGRSPIRTALAQLRNDGWISVSPQSGTYIRSLGEREIRDVLDLRLLLEAHVAQAAARNIGDDELRRLRRALERLTPNGAGALNEDSFAEFNEFDSMFHLALYNAAGNAMITEILLNLIDKVQWIKMSAHLSAQRIVSSYVELDRILAALEARDARSAAQRMREHIRNAAEYAADLRRSHAASTSDAVASTAEPQAGPGLRSATPSARPRTATRATRKRA